MFTVIETVLERVLNQITDWIGSEPNRMLFGSIVTLLALAIGIAGKRWIAALRRWWQGENLPVRESVQSLIARMKAVSQWTVRSGKLVGQLEARNDIAGLKLDSDGIWVGDSNVESTLNVHERNLVREELGLLFSRLDQLKIHTEEQMAEQKLLNALSKMMSKETTGDLVDPQQDQRPGVYSHSDLPPFQPVQQPHNQKGSQGTSGQAKK